MLKIPWVDKINLVIQKKIYFIRLTWPGLFLIYASGNHKQNFVSQGWQGPTIDRFPVT